MLLEHIKEVTIDKMERYSYDPHVTLHLRHGYKEPDHRYLFSGRLFYSLAENEVRHYTHDRNDHHGFGGAHFVFQMHENFRPDESGWRDCPYESRQHYYWDEQGRYCLSRDQWDWFPTCNYEGENRLMYIRGLWHGSTVPVTRALGQPVIECSSSEGYRCVTVEFMRQALDKFRPAWEPWEGDYGWTVKMRGMPPKNPRRHAQPVGLDTASGEQCAAIFA